MARRTLLSSIMVLLLQAAHAQAVMLRFGQKPSRPTPARFVDLSYLAAAGVK